MKTAIKRALRSCFKTLQLAHDGVKNRLKMLIYPLANCAFSPIFALSCTHLNNFKTASKECERNKLTNWRRMVVRIQGATTGA